VTKAEEFNQLALSKGDLKAYEMFFKTHYNHLCNYANTFLKDRDEAEEVVQNSFATLWEKRQTIQISGSVKSYMFSMVQNNSLNVLKHEKVKQKHVGEVLATTKEADTDDPEIHAVELEERIFSALQKLPEKCRMVFKLSRFEELKYAEIADKMEISIKTVENQMGKALRLMREELRDYLPLLLFLIHGLLNG